MGPYVDPKHLDPTRTLFVSNRKSTYLNLEYLGLVFGITKSKIPTLLTILFNNNNTYILTLWARAHIICGPKTFGPNGPTRKLNTRCAQSQKYLSEFTVAYLVLVFGITKSKIPTLLTILFNNNNAYNYIWGRAQRIYVQSY